MFGSKQTKPLTPRRAGALLLACMLGACADGSTTKTMGGVTTGGSGGAAGSSVPSGGVGGAAGFSMSGGSGGTGGTAGTNMLPSAGVGGVASGGSGGTPPLPGEYMSLAPAPGEAFTTDNATPIDPPPPEGWLWYSVANTFCRDGSQNGVYVRHTASDKLLIYFEGGGACTTAGFCNFNPWSVNHILTGDGETVLGTALAVGEGRQQPGVYSFGILSGIFDPARSENPFADWNMVYVPYCTGDVHFGSNDAAMVPGLETPQKMVGYKNTREFLSRIIPTFASKVTHVVATGASAGSFGAALNYSMISDSFPAAQVDAIMDSGVPFDDAQWPACLQQSWRQLFGLNESLPADCAECFNADGGGMLGLADFLIRKHPKGNLAAISSVHDEVIRLFFAPGMDNCATITTADPLEITLGQVAGGTIFPEADYQAGLMGVREKYKGTGRLASYMFGGEIATLHQHTFRDRFYEPVVGGQTIAAFVTEFLSGSMAQVGP
jgi:hypothetical protein